MCIKFFYLSKYLSEEMSSEKLYDPYHCSDPDPHCSRPRESGSAWKMRIWIPEDKMGPKVLKHELKL